MPLFILPRAPLECKRRLCCYQLSKHWYLKSSKLTRSIGYHVLIIVIGLIGIAVGIQVSLKSFLMYCFALLLSNEFIASNVLTCLANFHSKR